MGKTNHSKTSPKVIKAAEDTTKVLDYKRAGLTIRQIATAVDRSVGWVHKAIRDYVEAHPAASLEAYRFECIERHEGLISAHWASRSNPASAKVIQDSEKILISVMGAEAKREVDLSGSLTLTQETNDQLLDRLDRLAAAVAAGQGGSEPDAD